MTVLAIAAVLVSVWAGLAMGQAAATAKPTAVAVIDLQQVMSQVKEAQALQAEAQARGQDIQAEEERRRQEIQQLSGELDLFPPGSEQWEQKEQEVRKKLIELEVWLEHTRQQAQREQARQIAQLYQKAADTAGAVAADNGFDMVIQEGALPEQLDNLNRQQLSNVLSNRKVIWARDGMEITQQVITRMDNQFQAVQLVEYVTPC